MMLAGAIGYFLAKFFTAIIILMVPLLIIRKLLIK